MLAIARAWSARHGCCSSTRSHGLAPMVVGELYELVAHIAADGVTVIVVEQFVSTAVRWPTMRRSCPRPGSPAGEPDEMAEAALGAYLSSEG